MLSYSDIVVVVLKLLYFVSDWLCIYLFKRNPFSYLAFYIEFNSCIQDFTTSQYLESYSSVLIESTVYTVYTQY